MKKYIYITLCLLIYSSLFAQRDDFVCYHTEDSTLNLRAGTPKFSGNGRYFTPKGDLRALIICVGFGPQYDSTFTVGGWDSAPNALPAQLLDKSTIYSDTLDFSTYADSRHNKNVSRFYYEMSHQKFRFMAEVYPRRINIDATGAGGFYELNKRTIRQMEQEDPYFDWSRYDLRKNNPNYYEDAGGYASDGKPDFIIFLYRYSSSMPNQPVAGMAEWMGSKGGYDSSSLNDTTLHYNGYTFTGSGYTQGTCAINFYRLFIHEAAHGIYDCPHYAGANGVVGNYFYSNSGWGMMSLEFIPFPCALGWEKWYLNWIDGIKANGVNTDIKSALDLNASGEYTLRDFLSTDDVIRIKIPYTSSGKDQYLWLENHQGVSMFDQRATMADGCGNPASPSPQGLVAYIESVNNDRTNPSSGTFVAGANGIKYLHPAGNFDYAFDTPYSEPCHLWWNKVYNFRETCPNPIGGQSRMEYIRQDYDSNNTITIGTDSNSGGSNENASVSLRDSVFTYDFWAGEITFAPGSKLSMSSNPCLVNVPKYDMNTKKLTAFILNGISVKLLNYTNGNAKVKIAYNDVAIDNNIRYTGLIHLPDITRDENPDIIIQQGVTLSIDKSGTPNRHTKTSAGDFINPTEFHCLENSFFKQEKNSVVEIKNGSTLIIGGKYEINRDAQLRIKPGSYLQIKEAADLWIKDYGKIIVEPGAYICVEPGASINLDGTSSVISIQMGAQFGANPDLFSAASCQSDISYTGTGKIIGPINGLKEITCKETTFSSNDSLRGATYKWTCSPNIEISTPSDIKEIKVKGLSYHADNSWIKVTVISKVKTNTAIIHMETKQVTVNIPDKFSIEPDKFTELGGGMREVILTATPSPAGVKASLCSYQWNAKGGTISTGFPVHDLTAYEGNISPDVLRMMNDAMEGQSEVSNAVGEDTVSVRRLASTSNESSPSKSAVFEVSTTSEEETSTEYVALETGGTAGKTVEQADQEYAFLPYGWNKATLTFPRGATVMVNCSITGCSTTYSASLIIASWPYICSYTPSNRCIRFDKDLSLPSDGIVHTYRVMLYNDSGYLRTATFTSSSNTLILSLADLPNGNYYINVLDEHNFIVERKVIPITNRM
ncbi:MAG: hypothetical protein LBP83_02700 [Dysgonamonadaceae bacterium]|jgi:hypothetical protein|nr:hypothetical protein [Dysgonamonadaceae bacterium]